MVDCTDCIAREPIPVSRLPPAAEVADSDLLLVHTGWDEHWGTGAYRNHPYLAAEAAEWCADRGLAVGVDTYGPDPIQSIDTERESAEEPDGFPADHTLLGAGYPLVETLRGLERLAKLVTLTALPLSSSDADGSPVRAVAEPR